MIGKWWSDSWGPRWREIGIVAFIIIEDIIWFNFTKKRTLNLIKFKERLILQVVVDYWGEERRNYNSNLR